MNSSAERRAPLDGLWVGLFFLAVYVLLRQETLYGDGPHLLVLTSLDTVAHSYHMLYLPVVQILRGLVEPAGASVFEVSSYLSCTATAVGVVLAHRAFRILRFSRWDAVLAASLVGFAPGVLFYATVVEFQAVFFGFAALSFVACAAMAVRPTPGRAVLLGLATGISFLAHATGALLPLPLLLTIWATYLQNRRTGQGISLENGAVLTLIALLTHLAVMWGVPYVLRSASDSLTIDPDTATDFVVTLAEGSKPLSWGLEVLWNEWLLAFLPMSVLTLYAFFLRETRGMATALAFSVVTYLGASFVLLNAYSEHGAYLLPLAWPAAWIALRCSPRRVVLASVLLAAITAVTMVKLYDQPERSQDFAAGLREVAGGAPVALLLGGTLDREARFVRLPDVPFLPLGYMALHGREVSEELLPQMDLQLSRWFAEGRRIFFSSEVEAMARPGTFLGSEALEQVILAHLASRYDLVAVRGDGFRGKELRSR